MTRRSSKGKSPVDRPSTDWIPEELLTKTMSLWSRYYGRPVERDEAIEILMNVKRLALALADVDRQSGPPV